MEAALADLDRYPHPHLAVDVALLTLHERALHVLLLRRSDPPHADTLALPGGFVRIDESLSAAAARVLADKCGLQQVFLEQLYTFGAVDRDPRGRVVRAQPLAFDHSSILGTAVQRLRGKIDYAPVGFELLPPEFTLLELLQVHEVVLGRELNKDSFRRRMLASGLLAETGRERRDGAWRPAALYRFRQTPEDLT